MLFAISDLHLALSNPEKSLEVFGVQWANYIERLKENWNSSVGHNDVVLMPGDLSWATYIDEADEDFKFLNQLNGIKLLSKGNHDYWWTTAKKLNEYLKKNSFETISIVNNNSYIYKHTAICGSRGWICPDSDGFNEEDAKIYARELIRLELSLQTAPKDHDIIVMLHYPPFKQDGTPDDAFLEVMKGFGVKTCLFGHLHKQQRAWCEGLKQGIEFKLVTSDYLGFSPLKILD